MDTIGFDELKYLEFHRDLAVRHKVLQHSEAKKSFFGDDSDEFTSTQDSAKRDFVMNMLTPRSRMEGSSAAANEIVIGGFELMGKVSEKHATNYREREKISAQAKQYGLQIISAIAYAVFEKECPDLAHFDINMLNISKVYYTEHWVGYSFTYPLGNGEMVEFDDEEEFFNNLSY